MVDDEHAKLLFDYYEKTYFGSTYTFFIEIFNIRIGKLIYLDVVKPMYDSNVYYIGTQDCGDYVNFKGLLTKLNITNEMIIKFFLEII